ncbi:glycoside hydrolase family 97 protein [Balneolales bacterium ANBcel1]|nr:glycoside hydrolase family 97 protein [Balneolales bacterium ANBcel1]
MKILKRVRSGFLLFTVSLLTLQISEAATAGMVDNEVVLRSPDGLLVATVTIGADIRWTITHDGDLILDESSIAMHLDDGTTFGANPVLTDVSERSADEVIHTRLYKKSEVPDRFNELALSFEGDFGLIFRAYDDGAAYRFVTSHDGELTIRWEDVAFNFAENHVGHIPYLETPEGVRYSSSFESFYNPFPLTEFDPERLSHLPLVIEVGDKRAALLEVDVEDYPGMFIVPSRTHEYGLSAHFARHSLEELQSGYNNLQLFSTKRANYIARTDGDRVFPWRAVVVANEDAELLDNDMVFRLASPSRIDDDSWIREGQLAWDWWNDWNISGVDFEAGINTETYKHYIDFAAENGIAYILLDEGWSIESNNLMETIPEIDLEAIIAHGKANNVDVLLWAGWVPVHRDMEEIFALYAGMGVRGFKIDFMDRNDQFVINFHYRAARKAAKYEMLVNYHGTYPPTGLQRTWPNAITYEGVRGLEYHKWEDEDLTSNNVAIPFTRMLAGPMDYTPGGMRNANRHNFRPVHSMPMTQGTRCHQLAMYVMYESPLAMLADNPSAYRAEQESVDFITSIPTVFDETVPLAGKIGEYAAIARRNGDNWYVGAMTNWDGKELTLDFSFLPEGEYEAVIFRDGVNANRDARDYVREVKLVTNTDRISVSMASGGGWVARLVPIR